MVSLWTAEVYVDDAGRSPFAAWLASLSESKFGALDAGLRIVLLQRGIEVAGTEWLKPLGDGLWEFRVRHDATAINHMFGGEALGMKRRGGKRLDAGKSEPMASTGRLTRHVIDHILRTTVRRTG